MGVLAEVGVVLPATWQGGGGYHATGLHIAVSSFVQTYFLNGLVVAAAEPQL